MGWRKIEDWNKDTQTNLHQVKGVFDEKQENVQKLTGTVSGMIRSNVESKTETDAARNWVEATTTNTLRECSNGGYKKHPPTIPHPSFRSFFQ